LAIIAGEQKYTNIPVSILAIYAIPHDRGPTVNKDTAARAALEAFQKRHLYGVTDHILAEFSCGSHIMGDAFTSSAAPSFRVKLTGTAPFAKVHVKYASENHQDERTKRVPCGSEFWDQAWADAQLCGRRSAIRVMG
jgi:hypothetical protein